MLTKSVVLEIHPLTPNSRSYLNHWIQPDTDVPESQGVQAYDRYAYTNNNPLKYIDPTGHTIGLPPVAIDPCRLNPEFCQELLNNESTPPNPNPPFDNSLGGNNTNTPSGTSGTPSSSTCPGAVAGGALLIIALAPIDFGLVVANIAVLDVPVLGPIVEVVILVPVDLAVIDLHFVGASILWQGSIKSCDDINVELLPPWGFDR